VLRLAQCKSIASVVLRVSLVVNHVRLHASLEVPVGRRVLVDESRVVVQGVRTLLLESLHLRSDVHHLRMSPIG